jgi:predicted HicB family RNase H-like nuclease
MVKTSWAKGRKEPTCLVRLDSDIHIKAKIQADKESVSLKEWVSLVVRDKLTQLGL